MMMNDPKPYIVLRPSDIYALDYETRRVIISERAKIFLQDDSYFKDWRIMPRAEEYENTIT